MLQIKQQSEQLIFYGVLLFLLGLVVGLFVPLMANPRMGVSSHIEGVINGMFLILLGLIWHKILLPDHWLKITFWMALFGTFANCIGILIAAIFNGGKTLTIMAEGQESSAIVEGIVGFLLISLSIAMITVSIATLIGIRNHMRSQY